MSDGQINLYYSIPTDTASGTLTNDIGVSTPYGSDSANFYVYDPQPYITSVSPSTWNGGSGGTVTIGGYYFGSSSSVSLSGDSYATVAKISQSGEDSTGYGTITATYGVSSSDPGYSASLTVSASSYTGSGFYDPATGVSAMASTSVAVAPLPTITSISGGPFIPGNTYSVTISGTHFGIGGTVTVDSGSFSVSSWGSSISGTLTVPQSDTNFSLQFLVWPYYSQSSPYYGVTLGCGDARNSLIYQYISYSVDLTPQCSWFTQTASSPNFTYAELTISSGALWALIREPLTISGASYGLEQWRYLLGGTTQTVNSGYRSPAHNAAVSGRPNSRHMHGDAVDLNNSSHSEDEYNTKSAAATSAGADYVEPLSGPCGLGCVHAGWRLHSGSYE